MNKAVIWDLDETLLDSYPMIVESIYELADKYDLDYDKKTILDYVKKRSVHEFLILLSNQSKVTFEEIKLDYSEISYTKKNDITIMKNGKDILQILTQRNIRNFVYTHKGESTCEVLKSHGLFNFFDEIITSKNGFKRKPNPEALFYLIDTYLLDPKNTYYIGDRQLDIDCGKNAGIQSILLTEDSGMKSDSDYKVTDLLEIQNII